LAAVVLRAGLLPLCCLLLGLAGCGPVLTEATSDAAGVAGAGIAGAVTRNGAVTAAIGLGVQSAAATGLGFLERRVHRAEQDRIAGVAGALSPGAVAPWRVSHAIPIEEDEAGEVSVSRDFGGGLLACKEIVFSVDHLRARRPQRRFYVASICRDGEVWRWAEAEPATSRWGTLQ
jgi:hypothetical protein